MLCAIFYSYSSLSASHFVACANVWVLKTTPSAYVIDENGGEVTVFVLDIR
ncbi:hypothetical protein D3C80_1198300 [compost metagenome]